MTVIKPPTVNNSPVQQQSHFQVTPNIFTGFMLFPISILKTTHHCCVSYFNHQGAVVTPSLSCVPRSTQSLRTVLMSYNLLISAKLEWFMVGLEHKCTNSRWHRSSFSLLQLGVAHEGGPSKQKLDWSTFFFRHLFAEVTVMDVLFFIARREWILHYLSVIKIKQSQGNMNIRKMNVWYWGVLCLFVLVLSLYHSAGQWRCFKYDCKPVGPTTG